MERNERAVKAMERRTDDVGRGDGTTDEEKARAEAESSEGSGSRPARPRGGETRSRVLDAAEKIFSTYGYDGASIGDIAAAAGVAVGTVYHHFPDKRSVFLVLLEEFPARRKAQGAFTDEQGPLGAAMGAADPRAAIAEAIWHVHVRRSDSGGILSVAWNLGRRDPEVEARCQAIQSFLLEVVRKDIRRGQAAGRMRKDIDIEAGSILLYDAYSCLLARLARAPVPSEEESRRLVEAFVDLVCCYLMV